MPLTDNFTKNDIQRYLDNYKKISIRELNRKKKGKFIVYISKKDKMLNLGGIIINNTNEEFIMLKNGEKTWSVQKDDNIFYADVDNDISYYLEKINNNNNILNNLKSSKVLFKEFNNIENILTNLYQNPRLNIKNINKIKEEYGIEDFEYIKKEDLLYNDYIKYYDNEKRKLSTLGKVVDIRKTDNIIISVGLMGLYENRVYSWKIIPDKYYLFRREKDDLTKLLKKIIKNNK